MNILMVIPSYYPTVGGAEIQLENLSKFLIKKNHKITIATKKLRSSKDQEKINGIEIIRLSSFMYPLGFLFTLSLLLIRFRKKYDVIHVHTINSPALICSVFGRFFKKKVLIKITRSGENSQINNYLSSLLGRIYISLLRIQNPKIIYLTEDGLKEVCLCKFKDKFLIPNGITVKNYSYKNNNIPTFMIVGRLIERKRVDFVIKCWSKIERNMARLLIIGTGIEESSLITLSEKLSLDEEVIFIGEISNSQVQEYMRESDALILASTSEGLSNALLESMSNSLVPIVSSIVANTSIISDGKNGLVFDSEECLVDKISTLINDKNLRGNLSYEANTYVRKNFSMELVADKYSQLYSSK